MNVVFEVVLGPHAQGARFARLREPCGLDEQRSEEMGPVAASELLEQLLVDGSGSALRREALPGLPLCERDQLIAALYARQFGDRVESTVSCSACRETCEVSFSLASLLESIVSSSQEDVAVGPDANGHYALAGGLNFRLPNIEDERAIRGLPSEQAEIELLRRCVVSERTLVDAEEERKRVLLQSVGAAMEKVAPVLDLDFLASCSMCGAQQSVHFDMVSFFMTALMRERQLLAREVHRLASAYRWTHEDILRLPTKVRRLYVALAEAERGRSRAFE